ANGGGDDRAAKLHLVFVRVERGLIGIGCCHGAISCSPRSRISEDCFCGKRAACPRVPVSTERRSLQISSQTRICSGTVNHLTRVLRCTRYRSECTSRATQWRGRDPCRRGERSTGGSDSCCPAASLRRFSTCGAGAVSVRNTPRQR